MNVGECSNNKDLLMAVEQLRNSRIESRRPFEEQWWNNIAFYAGDHYSEWDAQRAAFRRPKQDQHSVRLVINQARVIVRQEISKVTKARPIMDCTPKSNEEQDISAAKVGNFILESTEGKFKLRRVRRNAFRWATICGVGAVYVGYDPNDDTDGKIQIVIDPATNEPVWHPERESELKELDAKGEQDLVQETYALGDMEFKVYGPFQLLPDDTVETWDELKDIIVTDVIELEKAKDLWPDQARRIRPDNEPKSSIGARFLRRSGLVERQSASEDTVSIHSYWLEPGVYNGKYLEDGKMVRWCNQDVDLEWHDAFPFQDGELPFAFFIHTTNPISIWPDTTLTDIRPINLELDKTISQILENRDYMVNPMWLKAFQSQVGPIKSQPGGEVEFVHVRDVPPPQQMPGVALPTQIENLVVGLRDMILDVAGSSEVSRGNVPSGVRAGNMLAFLDEQDQTQIAPIVEDFEDTVAHMATLCLSRYSQFYTIERLVRNYRPGGRTEVMRFKGADLKGHTDVVVQAGSALPKLKAARQQYVMQLAEMGIETDPKRIKDMLELGEGEPDEIDLAFMQADRENDLMIRAAMNLLTQEEKGSASQQPLAQNYGPGPGPSGNGVSPAVAEGAPEEALGLPSPPPEGLPGEMPPEEAAPEEMEQPLPEEMAAQSPQPGMPGLQGPPPQDDSSLAMMAGPQGAGGTSFAIPVKKWHIHAAHLSRHRRKMMGPEFETLALRFPDVVRLFDEHTALHEQALQEEQMQQMQMMALAQGGPAATTPPPGAQPGADAAATAQAEQVAGGMPA